MISAILLGAFSNLLGLDGVIILAVQGALVVGIILLVRFVVRRNAPDHSAASLENRLRKLDLMRGAGVITDVEYAEQRRRILSQV